MKCTIRSIALAAALLATSVANAAIFDFSYAFGDGTSVTGSFNGDSDGSQVSNLSNISVAVNGVSLAGSGSWYAYAADWYHPPVVTFDGNSNIFIFSSSDSPGDGEVFGIYPFGSSMTEIDAVLISNLLSTYNIVDDGSIGPRWSLTEVSAVPEPGAYGMLLAGLGLLGFMARRKQT